MTVKGGVIVTAGIHRPWRTPIVFKRRGDVLREVMEDIVQDIVKNQDNQGLGIDPIHIEVSYSPEYRRDWNERRAQ